MNQVTDEELMEEVAHGNLDVMSQLFERYHKWIYNFFFQMTANEALCEDLTQTVFYKAIRYRTSYKGGKFASWIFTIARNVFSDQYRSAYNKMSQVPTEGLEVVADNHEKRDDNSERLHYVLNKLKVDDRELIVMSKFQDMKYQQIAELIGSNETAVKTRIHRIIKKMRTLYFETV